MLIICPSCDYEYDWDPDRDNDIDPGDLCPKCKEDTLIPDDAF